MVLGLQFNASALQTKGFENVLWDAYKATGGSTEKMAQLFGSVEALNAVLVLGSDKTGNFKTDLEKMGLAAGATQVAYDKVANEFGNINQRLANNFKITLSEIGEKLMPEYGKIAGSMGTLLSGIKVGLDKGAFDPLFAELDKATGGIAKWLADVGKAFPEALKQIDFGGLAKAFNEFGKAFVEAFSLDKVNSKQLADSMQLVVDSVTSLIDVTKGMGEVFAPFLNTIKEAITAFNSLDSSTKTIVGNILGLSIVFKAFGPLGLIFVGMGLDAETMAKGFTVSFGAIENGINTLKVAVLSLAMVFATASDGMAQLLSKMAMTDERKTAAAEDLARTGERVKILSGLLEEAQTNLAVSSNKVSDAMFGAGEKTKAAESNAASYAKVLNEIPKEIKEITAAIVALPTTKQITVGIQADGSSIEKANGMIIQTFPDGGKLLTNDVVTVVDGASLDSATKTIDKAIPDKKVVDITAQIDMANIKAQSEIIGKALEWKAKVDIAEIEATSKKVEAAFKSTGESVTSTGSTLSSLVGSLANLKASEYGGDILKQVQAESNRRSSAMALQKTLVDAQVSEMNARTRMMDRGQAMIQIDGSGLAPQLEAFMFEILKAIQIRANSEGAAFLTGI